MSQHVKNRLLSLGLSVSDDDAAAYASDPEALRGFLSRETSDFALAPKEDQDELLAEIIAPDDWPVQAHAPSQAEPVPPPTAESIAETSPYSLESIASPVRQAFMSYFEEIPLKLKRAAMDAGYAIGAVSKDEVDAVARAVQEIDAAKQLLTPQALRPRNDGQFNAAAAAYGIGQGIIESGIPTLAGVALLPWIGPWAWTVPILWNAGAAGLRKYSELRNAGYEPHQAAIPGLAMGAIGGILSRLGDKWALDVGKEVMKETVKKAMISEGLEELGEEAFEIALDKTLDAMYASYEGEPGHQRLNQETFMQNLARMGLAFAGGAIGGAVLSPAAKGIEFVSNKVAGNEIVELESGLTLPVPRELAGRVKAELDAAGVKTHEEAMRYLANELEEYRIEMSGDDRMTFEEAVERLSNYSGRVESKLPPDMAESPSARKLVKDAKEFLTSTSVRKDLNYIEPYVAKSIMTGRFDISDIRHVDDIAAEAAKFAMDDGVVPPDVAKMAESASVSSGYGDVLSGKISIPTDLLEADSGSQYASRIAGEDLSREEVGEIIMDHLASLPDDNRRDYMAWLASLKENDVALVGNRLIRPWMWFHEQSEGVDASAKQSSPEAGGSANGGDASPGARKIDDSPRLSRLAPGAHVVRLPPGKGTDRLPTKKRGNIERSETAEEAEARIAEDKRYREQQAAAIAEQIANERKAHLEKMTLIKPGEKTPLQELLGVAAAKVYPEITAEFNRLRKEFHSDPASARLKGDFLDKADKAGIGEQARGRLGLRPIPNGYDMQRILPQAISNVAKKMGTDLQGLAAEVFGLRTKDGVDALEMLVDWYQTVDYDLVARMMGSSVSDIRKAAAKSKARRVAKADRITIDEANRIVAEHRKRYPGASRSVIVSRGDLLAELVERYADVNGIHDLDEAHREFIASHPGTVGAISDGRTKAMFFRPDGVFFRTGFSAIIEDAITTKADLIDVLAHENIGHYYFSKQSEADKAYIRSAIKAMLNMDADKMPPEIKDTYRAMAVKYPELVNSADRGDRFYDEFFANLLERTYNNYEGISGAVRAFIRKAIAGIKNILRRIGILNEYTEPDIWAVVADAVRTASRAPASSSNEAIGFTIDKDMHFRVARISRVKSPVSGKKLPKADLRAANVRPPGPHQVGPDGLRSFEMMRFIRSLLRDPDIGKVIANSKVSKFIARFTGRSLKFHWALLYDRRAAEKALAHSIGRVIAYVGDTSAKSSAMARDTFKRGNILGVVAGLIKFRKNLPGLDSAAITDQLEGLSQWWNGTVGVKTGNPVDLFADAISVMLNDGVITDANGVQHKAIDVFAPGFKRALVMLSPKYPDIKKFLDYTSKPMDLRYDLAAIDALRRIKNADALEALRNHLSKQNVGYTWKQHLIDENSYYLDLVKALKGFEAYQEEKDAIQRMLYADTEFEALLSEVKDRVESVFQSDPDAFDKFRAYLYYKRIASGGRKKAAVVIDGTVQEIDVPLLNMDAVYPEDAAKILAAPEMAKDAAKFEKARQELTKIWQSKIVAPAKAAGIFSNDLIKTMEMNTDYVTFAVSEYIRKKYGDHAASSISRNVYEQYGSVKDIIDPLAATIVKGAQILRLIKTNAVKRNMVAFLQEYMPTEIVVAQRDSLSRFIPPPDEAHELVVVMSNGTTQGYYVDKRISGPLSPADAGDMKNMLSSFGEISRLYRLMYTTYNFGFQFVRNPIRDIWNLIMNMPMRVFIDSSGIKERAKTGILAQWWRAWRDLRNKRAGAISEDRAAQLESDLAALRENGLYVPGIDWGNANSAETLYIRMMQAAGLDTSGVVPSGTGSKAQAIVEYLRGTRVLGTLMRYAEDWGHDVEKASKLAAFRYLSEIRQRDPSFMSQAEMNNRIRAAGSPPFLVKGRSKKALDALTLFFNPNMQYWRSRWNAMWDGIKSGKDYSVAVKNLLIGPGLLFGFKEAMQWALMHLLAKYGWLGEQRRHLYMNIPERIRESAPVIPLGFTEDGKTVYFEMPTDPMLRSLIHVMKKAVKGEPIMEVAKLVAVSAYNEATPSLNPVVKHAIDVMVYASGGDPTDWRTGRPILSEEARPASVGGGANRLQGAIDLLIDIYNRSLGTPLGRLPAGMGPRDLVTAWISGRWNERGRAEVFTFTPGIAALVGPFIRITDEGMMEPYYKAREANRIKEFYEFKTAKDVAENLASVITEDDAVAIIDAVDNIGAGQRLTNEQVLAIVKHSDAFASRLKSSVLRNRGVDKWIRELVKARTRAERALVVQEMAKYYGEVDAFMKGE